MRSGTLFLCLFLLIGARSAAAEFGSEKEGFTIRLTGDWKSVSLLSKLLDSETSRLTAFRDLTGKTPLVVHILSTDGFGDLNFNRQAVVDALSKDRQIVGGIRQSTVKIGNCDAARLEFRRKGGKKIIQYLLLAEKHLWSILFIGPEKMSAEQIREIDADAASFRLRAAAQ